MQTDAPMQMTEMMQMNGMGGGGPMMIVMMLLWLLLIVAVAWLVWRALRGGFAGTERRGESSGEILKRRYAKGEIDRTTYERIRDDIAPGARDT